MIDLPMSSGSFTWTNSQQPPILVRLDRFLVSDDWKAHLTAILQMSLTRPISDHTSIMLCCNSGVKFKALFRLENYLLLHPTFLPNLDLWWRNLTFFGKPSFVFAKKLQSLNFFIKIFKKSLGDIQYKLDQLEETIDSLDIMEEDAQLTQDDVIERELARIKHKSLSLDLVRKWGQRAKERWVKDGETNSRYIYQLASFKYNCNNINCLSIDGSIRYDKGMIAA